MLNNNRNFVLLKEKLLIDTKLHRHGDVHTIQMFNGRLSKIAA